MKQDEFYIENSSKPFHVEARFEATDFRLGNWFLGNGYMQQVTLETFEYLLNERFYPHKAIQGVPLTPEILESTGFEIERGWGIIFRMGDLPVGIEMSDDSFYLSHRQPQYDGFGGIENERWERINPSNISYVHQLQNLYFALTGEELPINL
jgi:hypothetical protein